MSLLLTDGDKDVPALGGASFSLAATASAGVRRLNWTVLQGSGRRLVGRAFLPAACFQQAFSSL
jgi:hypothetical protein